MAERESMHVDVVIVGGGPSGLSAAIRLKQLAEDAGTELSIVVLEKGPEIGAHVLSGAVIDPAGLDALIPGWRDKGAPLTTQVTSDRFTFLTRSGGFSIPHLLLPPLFRNQGNYIGSLGRLCQWLAKEAETMGVNIPAGFAATEVLYKEDGSVRGVASGDMGVAKDGSRKPGFEPGMEFHARYTLIAEGARGSIAKQLIERFGLDRNCEPQKYGIGLKEIWEIESRHHREGHVEHTLGWPLPNDTGGGGFIYHAAENKLFIGFVVHLNYTNPHLSPFDEMQRFKTHPRIRTLLEKGRRISFGARAMTSGGWQSIPELAFPGGALIGCSAGFMNLPRIKGTHNAMLSGKKTAEAVFEALRRGRGNDLIEGLNDKVVKGEIERDLYRVRNTKPLLSKLGTRLGTLASGLDLWTQTLFKFSLLGTLGHAKPDYAYLRPAADAAQIIYPKPDRKLTFDRASSIFLANIRHDDDQPVHLRLRDLAVPVNRNLPLYDEPAQRYCPAGVYEIIDVGDQDPVFQINAANCIHCKTCDIKDPSQNITWYPPEGGSGPNYQGM